MLRNARYTYYAFAAMRIRPNPIPAMLLTTAQLSQMALGVLIHAACFYLYYAEGNVYNGVQVRSLVLRVYAAQVCVTKVSARE